MRRDLPEYYRFFIKTDLAGRFEKGDPFVVSGRSGVELARDIIERMTGEELTFSPIYHDDRSREFWAGWALAYYQWFCGCTFRQLDEELPIESIMIMYDKYHEMDIMHFVDSVDDMRSKARITS